MKFKKGLLIGCTLSISLLLGGCFSPATPKEAYIKGGQSLQAASSYEKKSDLQIETEATGLWYESDTTLFSLINQTNFSVKTVKDVTKQQSNTIITLTGGFEFLPLNASVATITDEKAKKTYIKGKDLHALLATFSPSLQGDKATWITVENTESVLPTDLFSALSTLPETQFVRVEVGDKEKKEGVRDVIKVALNAQEVASLFPTIDTAMTPQGLSLTVYLDRKGKILKEEISSKLIYKKEKKELILHAAITSSYEQINQPVTVSAPPTTEPTLSLKEFLSHQKETP